MSKIYFTRRDFFGLLGLTGLSTKLNYNVFAKSNNLTFLNNSDLPQEDITSSLLADFDWEFFHKTESSDKTALLFQALEVNFSPKEKDNFLGHNVFIYADTVNISGKIELPKQNIKICARKIICSDNAEINVSAPENKDTKKPKTGQKDGLNGEDGEEGLGGDKAGKCWRYCENLIGDLKINTSGGKGGLGGDAGNGVKGGKGDTGSNASQSGIGGTGHQGGKGKIGGNSGRGGKGGKGGDAGTISFGIINQSNNKLSFTSEGGLGVIRRTSGNAGLGGDGGDGGKSFACHLEEIMCCCREPCNPQKFKTCLCWVWSNRTNWRRWACLTKFRQRGKWKNRNRNS